MKKHMLVACALGASAILVSCQKNNPNAVEPNQPPAVRPKAGGAKPAKPLGKPYEVTVTAPKGAVGAELLAAVKLVPKGPYKVNLEYPTKLTIKAPDGVRVEKAVMKAKDAKTFTKKEALFQPSAKATVAGDHAFSAIFKFSVCTDKQCELKTETLSWVASVK